MQITQTLIDSVTWTAIRAPVGCIGVTIQDAALATAIRLRSNPTLATTELLLPIGTQGRVITSPMARAAGNYGKGSIVTYAQAVAGTVTLVGTFI